MPAGATTSARTRPPMTHARVLAIVPISLVLACSEAPSHDDDGTDGSGVTHGESSGGASASSFREVAEILGRRCTACHGEGTVAPFAIATHADVASWAQPIATAVTNRTMPPWGVDDSGACQSYV